MVEQVNFDSMVFPVPEDHHPKKRFYLMELRYFSKKTKSFEFICGKYYEKRKLENLLDFIVVCYYNLFLSPINVQIARKGDEHG